jgi:hypothetical protein
MPRNSRLLTVVVLVAMAFASSGCQIMIAPSSDDDRERDNGSLALSSQGDPLTDADVASYLACAADAQPSALLAPAGESGIAWGTVGLILGATVLIATLASM